MADDAKIKISADISDFEKELEKLNNYVSSLRARLNDAGAKTSFNLDGTTKELEAIHEKVLDVSEALGSGGKSKEFVNRLKEAKKVLEDAVKVAKELEHIGDKKPRISSDIGQFENAVEQQIADNSAYTIAQRLATAEATQQQREEKKHTDQISARNERWARNAGKIAGFVAGAAQGGGGGYAQLGSAAGQLLPGAWGAVASQIGGMVGGMADKSMQPLKDEGRTYSELRRGMGDTAIDFETLRGATRELIEGLLLTNVEASQLAKQFAKTAGLTENRDNDISRTVGTAGGIAKAYGIEPGPLVDMFAQMRLSGNAKSDTDNRKIGMQIAEGLVKSGTPSIKMDETLNAISNFAKTASSTNYQTPDIGAYSALLMAMTGSKLPGLQGQPNNAAGLLARADEGSKAGGSMGQISQTQQMYARSALIADKEGKSGIPYILNEQLQNLPLTGSYTESLSERSPEGRTAKKDYEEGKKTGNRQKMISWELMEETRKAFEQYEKESGLKANNLTAYIKRAEQMSHGVTLNTEAIIARLTGLSSTEATVLYEMAKANPKGFDDLQTQLDKRQKSGKKVDMENLQTYATIYEGKDADRKLLMEKLQKESPKGWEPEDIAKGKTLFESKLKKGETQEDRQAAIKDFLATQLEKQGAVTDPGLENQKTQIQLTNKITEQFTELLGIETIIKSAILSFAEKFLPPKVVEGLHAQELERLKSSIGNVNKGIETGETAQGKPVTYESQKEILEAQKAIIEEKDPVKKKALSDKLKAEHATPWWKKALANDAEEIATGVGMSMPFQYLGKAALGIKTKGVAAIGEMIDPERSLPKNWKGMLDASTQYNPEKPVEKVTETEEKKLPDYHWDQRWKNLKKEAKTIGGGILDTINPIGNTWGSEVKPGMTPYANLGKLDSWSVDTADKETSNMNDLTQASQWRGEKQMHEGSGLFGGHLTTKNVEVSSKLGGLKAHEGKKGLSVSMPTYKGKTGINDKAFIDYLSKSIKSKFPELKSHQIAAMIGNMAEESGNFKKMQENNPKGGGRGGLGYMQWTGSRRRDFEAFLKESGKSANDPSANIEFMSKELHGKEAKNYAKFVQESANSNTSGASTSFMRHVERPGVEHADIRAANSEKAYAQMDRIPTDVKPPVQIAKDSFYTFNHNITLMDQNNNVIPAPVATTTHREPRAASRT